MEKQKLIELLRKAYLSGIMENELAGRMVGVNHNLEDMATHYAEIEVNNGVLDAVSERNIAIGDYVWYNERIHKVEKIRFDDKFWKGKEIAIIDIQAKDTKDVPTRVLRYVR